MVNICTNDDRKRCKDIAFSSSRCKCWSGVAFSMSGSSVAFPFSCLSASTHQRCGFRAKSRSAVFNVGFFNSGTTVYQDQLPLWTSNRVEPKSWRDRGLTDKDRWQGNGILHVMDQSSTP